MALLIMKYITIMLYRLENGSYQLVETKSPDGYQLDTTPILFTVDDETTVINVTKYNVKVVQDKPVISVDKNDNNGIIPNRSSGASKNQTVVANYQETKKQEPKKLSVNGNHTYFLKTSEKANKWIVLIGGIVVVSGIGCAILANKREKSSNK